MVTRRPQTSQAQLGKEGEGLYKCTPSFLVMGNVRLNFSYTNGMKVLILEPFFQSIVPMCSPNTKRQYKANKIKSINFGKISNICNNVAKSN